jgi:hypothetical protein
MDGFTGFKTATSQTDAGRVGVSSPPETERCGGANRRR